MRRLSWLKYALLFAIIVALIRVIGPDFRTQSPPIIYRQDFAQEWLIGRSLLNGHLPYPSIDELRTIHGLPNDPEWPYTYPTPHPPTAGLPFIPLALIEYVTAARIWFGIQLILVVLSGVLLYRLSGLPRPSFVSATALYLILAGNPFSLSTLWVGQTTFLHLTLLACIVFAMRARYDVVAGILIAIALAVKPLFWLVVPFLLVRRCWRTLSATALTGGAIVLAAVALAGVQPFIDWLAALGIDREAFIGEPYNFSLWRFGVFPAMIAILISCWATWRCSVPSGLAVVAAIGPFLAPVAWSFYGLFLLVPIALGIRWLRSHWLTASLSLTRLSAPRQTAAPVAQQSLPPPHPDSPAPAGSSAEGRSRLRPA